jgi:DNA-binding MarR family transcriptional regulator
MAQPNSADTEAAVPAAEKALAPHLYEVHHLLWECNMLMIPLGDAVFEDSDLSLALSGTLDAIGTWPGSTAAELARQGPKTQQAVSQAVSRLEKAGWVERRVGRGRGVELYLTESGEVARAEGHRREDLLEERMRTILGADTYAELVRQLTVARERLRGENPANGDI